MRATFVRTLWPFHYQAYEVSCTCDGGRKILRDTVFVWRVPREEKRTLQETGEQRGVLLGNEQDFDTGITLRAWTRIWAKIRMSIHTRNERKRERETERQTQGSGAHRQKHSIRR